MTHTMGFAEIATLAGDPARAGMLNALMDGRALAASELARVAGVTPQTASAHLTRLTGAGLLTVVKQGRHRYHRLASPAVARMLESLMQVATEGARQRPAIVIGPRDSALRQARTCYDHLAGKLGVALTGALELQHHIELTPDAGVVTEGGLLFFEKLGLDLTGCGSGKRVLCRPCLDWSERCPHLAGTLGAALCRYFFEENWIRRMEGTRALSITRKGEQGFRDVFGIGKA